MTKPNLTPPVLTPEQILKFWSYVDKSHGQGPQGTCWEWQGCRDGGYGKISIGPRGSARGYRTPRLSFFLEHGRWPEPNACHHCDNPPCVRPEHLFEGSARDNVLDAKEKGRLATGDKSGARLHPERMRRGDNHPMRINPLLVVNRGEKHNHAKLKDADVLEIRKLFSSKTLTVTAIANRYSITMGCVWLITRRKTWRHI